jgi:hypothetical protein
MLAEAVAIVAILAAAWLMLGPGREGFRFKNDRRWPTNAYYLHRWEWSDDPPPPPAVEEAPDMRWWRYPGYAAPLEVSLPLRNFTEYLYAYPPESRMPYNE